MTKQVGQAICWPRPGLAELIDVPHSDVASGETSVEVIVSVSNPGTERARFRGLPNANVGFPHMPGIGCVGHVLCEAGGVGVGAFVAVRCGTHQSVNAARVDRLRVLPDGTNCLDAALWQMGLIGMHGLGLGRYLKGEPIVVVGAGMVGAIVRRVATARGSLDIVVIAQSTAKRWTVQGEPNTRFLCAEQAGDIRGRYQLVVDAAGTPATLAVAVAAAADGGRVVLLGSPRVPTAVVPIGEIHDRGLSLVGAHIDTLPEVGAATGVDLLKSYTDEYFSLIEAGTFSMNDLVTVYSPDQAPILYRQLCDDRSLVGAAVAWRPRGRASTVKAGVCPSKPPLRFALVGCGDIGFENAWSLSRARYASLIACFDTDADLSRALGVRMAIRVANTLEDLLSDPNVDAVLVSTPHDTHEQLASAVLGAGKHLLLQKPLAADLASAQRIVRAAREAPSKTSMLLPGRYGPAYHKARRVFDEGLIGSPLGLVATYLIDKPPSYYRGGYSGRSASTWRLAKSRSGGGVIIMNLVHHIDIARSLLKADAEWVFAQTLPSPFSPEIEDFAAIMICFGGTVATFVGAASVPEAPGEHLRLLGTRGHCTIYPEWGFASSLGVEGISLKPEPDDPEVAAIDSFADAVGSGRGPDVSVDDALAIQAIVAAAYESARTGRPVRLASVPDGDA